MVACLSDSRILWLAGRANSTELAGNCQLYRVGRLRTLALPERKSGIAGGLVQSVWIAQCFYVGRFFLDRSLPFAGESHGIDFAAFLLLETLLYSIGLTFAATAMVQQRTERRYRQASLTDSLTGIGNRRSFVEDSENMLRHCQVQHRPVTLLLCDMDNFKQLNDRHGHQSGDHALVAFCDVTIMRLRKGDIFGRLGGEEFACLLPDTTTEAAYQMAERIRKEFASCSRVAGVSLSISIGVASSAEAGYVLDSLIALADKGLYEAKGLGKNRSVISQPV